MIDWLNLSRSAQLATSSGTGNFVLRVDQLINTYDVFTSDNDGQVVFYCAQSPVGSEAEDQYEEGSGIYNHATKTISRTSIYRSSNSDSPVNFTSAPIVFAVFGSELMRRLDVILNLTGAGTVLGARTQLGLTDSDINSLINSRIAAMQASGALPPDPTALPDGTLFQVQSGVYVTLT